MLFWAADGSVGRRELYRVDPDPREEGRDIAAAEPAKANELQARLLAYLESVVAESSLQPRSVPCSYEDQLAVSA